MQHSLFFKFSSFFVDREVLRTHSEHNKSLSIVLANNKYQLNSGCANYSFGNLHTAFQQAFSKTSLKTKPINKALILGFGAGSIAHILKHELKSTCSITGVEIDAKIIDLARTYFKLNKLTNCEVIVDDALHFLESKRDKYDLIVVDLFAEIDVPSTFQSHLFLDLLREHAAKSAYIYYNFVVDNGIQKQQFEQFEKLFNQVFPNSKTWIILEGNRMLFHKFES
jgi:spermidine synthase